MRQLVLALTFHWLAPCVLVAADETLTREEATDAMHRAVHFFRNHCSAGGGYVYRLSADLAKREGEGRVGPTTAWIEPPATPAVGLAYLDAWKLTKDPVLLEAARETAEALIRGQLQSGGWTEQIEFDPDVRRRYAYRVPPAGEPGRKGVRNTTTFDDDKSQSAMRFLMQLDQALDFADAAVHEASRYALDHALAAQYPNGAWPQRFEKPANPDDFPILKASFPETWSRTFPAEKYDSYYTLNDNTISDLIRTFLDAAAIYNDERYLEAARRGGDFLLLAQLPDPQPGWAQQYNHQMHPAWARKFEPPAISGSESQGVMRTLLLLARQTQDDKYLEPIPRALDYYESVKLDDGRLARFYEIGTNRPLYFTREYQLTYDDGDLPTHYGFKATSHLDRIRADYEKLISTPKERWQVSRTLRVPKLSNQLTRSAAEAVRTLDARGAWVERGRLQYHGNDDDTRNVIASRTFSNRLRTLAGFIAASQPGSAV